jgi:DNA-binding transcriptional regulator LsrR (DeoR family)
MSKPDATPDRLDDAARAGWLYYVAGRTQDEIARSMGISRQTAQRLVSLAVSARLIRVSVEHPIARCLELAQQLRDRFGLRLAEVVPSDPGEDGGTIGLGEAGSAEIARWLRRPDPVVMAIGTGRTLKSAVDLLPPLACPQHRVVSLTGSIGPDGSAAFYNVIFSMAARVSARHFPMPLPVFVSTAEERRLFHAQPLVASTLALAASADIAFVGVGEMDETAPLFVDGFIQRSDLNELRAAGAVGEICGWVFDARGQLVPGERNLRLASAAIPDRDRASVVALAKGAKKLAAIRAAVGGGLVNALITDEITAERLLGTR